MIRELDISDPDDRRILMGELDKPVSSSQSRIDEQVSDGNVVDFATDKQKALMDKLHIKYDKGVSKEQASVLISKKMDKGG